MMNPEETTNLLQQVQETNYLLRQMLAQMSKPKLGFTDTPDLFWVYANRNNNCLWYTIVNENEIVPIQSSAITAFLEEIKFEKVTRNDEEGTKLRVYLRGDRRYCIESGYNTNFAKGLLCAIASLSLEKVLAHPITIAPEAGEKKKSVLFCRCFYQDELIFVPYDENTNFREIATKAKSNCPKNQQTKSEAVAV